MQTASSTTKRKIGVMVVEDHILIRMGLMTISDVAPDIAVVAHAEDGKEAIETFRKQRPDVVLMDMRLPGMDGALTITKLREEFGDVRAIVLSTYGAEEDIYRALQAGASGYLLKDMPITTLVEAIRAVHAGRQYFPPEISNRLAARLKHSMLSERETDVLRMMAAGKSNKEIGVALGIVEGTVKVHVANIFTKLHVIDRTQAVTTAVKRGIIHLE
ncbi:MAG: response regulator transcription factor [Verrucomicrobia bacterium]|nr:MAG: response regulator transcription factor [Verrucomicrobiota bacterium]